MSGKHTTVVEEVRHPLLQQMSSGELRLSDPVVARRQAYQRRIKENEEREPSRLSPSVQPDPHRHS